MIYLTQVYQEEILAFHKKTEERISNICSQPLERQKDSKSENLNENKFSIDIRSSFEELLTEGKKTKSESLGSMSRNPSVELDSSSGYVDESDSISSRSSDNTGEDNKSPHRTSGYDAKMFQLKTENENLNPVAYLSQNFPWSSAETLSYSDPSVPLIPQNPSYKNRNENVPLVNKEVVDPWDFNTRFQRITEWIHTFSPGTPPAEKIRANEGNNFVSFFFLKKNVELLRLYKDFVASAKSYGKIIISEGILFYHFRNRNFS